MLTLYDLGRPLPGEAFATVRPARAAVERLTLQDHVRHALARVLRAASALLARHAREVARPLHAKQRRLAAAADPVVEFHADAGAPEGALYVDGRLVGYVDVTRL
jgi:hypothetical protein